MEVKVRQTAIDVVGEVPWGTHFCQFYQTKEDLIDVLVPYFKVGLENNEFCMWITSEPLNTEDAHRALKKKVRNLDGYIKKGQIEILDYSQWYTKPGHFDSDVVLQGWIEKEKYALEKGFNGLRLTGNTFWLEKRDWGKFTEYEAVINNVISKYRMLAICTYSIKKCGASEIIDVVSNHQFALIKREGKWGIIESAEHKKTAEALRQSEEKFRLAFENAVDAIFWADSETGLITNCNRAAEMLLEKKKADIIGQHQTTLHPPQKAGYYRDLFQNHVKQVKVFYDDGEVITGSGTIKPVSITASLTPVGEKQIMQGIFRDLTERKRAKKALRESRQRYKHLFEKSPVGIGLTSPEGKIVAGNKAMETLTGYSTEELKKVNVADIYDNPKDREALIEAVNRDDGVVNFPVRLRRKDGTPYDALLTISRVHIGGKDLFQTICIDITEHKQREEALQWAKRELTIRNKIAEIFLTVPDEEMFGEVLQVILEAMESEYGIFGYIDEHGVLIIPSLTRDIWERCRVPDKTIAYPREKWGGIWGRALIEKKSLFANEGLHVPEGHVPITRVLVVPVMYGGEVVGLLEVANKATDYGEKDRQFLEDIAGRIAPILHARLQRDRQERERKQAVEALHKSEKRYRELYEGSHDGYLFVNMKGNILEFNSASKNMLGYSEKELFQKTYMDLTPPKWHSLETRIVEEQVLKRGYSEIYEKEYIKKDGTALPIELRVYLVRDEKSKPTGMWAFVRDISERKQAEEALKCHEIRLQSLLDLNKMAGASQQEILDFVREEVIKVTQSKLAFIGFLNEDESVMSVDNWSRDAMAQCAVVDKPMNFPIAQAGLWAEAVRQRKPIIVNDYAAAGPYQKGMPRGHVPINRFLGVPVFDGERIVAVAAVANKENEYDESDVRAFTSMLNDMWRLICRQRAEEDLEQYRLHLEELVKARTEELTEANKQLLQEIEERKRLERTLLDISERERRRIGRELHDSIGQLFTGITFMAKVLEHRLDAKLPDEAANVAAIAKLVHEAMDHTRSLAKGLEPVDLDAGSLMSALQEFAATTENLFGIHCTFKCDKPIPIDDAEVAVHIYRIAQEAITNAIKHGKAKNIEIGLASARDKSVLTVKNDGVDLPKVLPKNKGMGLQIMDHRAEMVHGSLDIRRGDEGGTVVTCVFPNKRH
jgi:PAS domain S-box-containing protein